MKANGFTNIDTTNSSLPIQYQQCKNYDASSEDKSALLLAALEEFLGCGGWCDSDKLKFFRFTSINNCGTKGTYFVYFKIVLTTNNPVTHHLKTLWKLKQKP